jgi:hypothetical protein
MLSSTVKESTNAHGEILGSHQIRDERNARSMPRQIFK